VKRRFKWQKTNFVAGRKGDYKGSEGWRADVWSWSKKRYKKSLRNKTGKKKKPIIEKVSTDIILKEANIWICLYF
jgi:hypothetical protein